jgi:hypothetical protein
MVDGARPTRTGSGHEREREARQVIIDLDRFVDGRPTGVGHDDGIDPIHADDEIAGVTHGDNEIGWGLRPRGRRLRQQASNCHGGQ